MANFQAAHRMRMSPNSSANGSSNGIGGGSGGGSGGVGCKSGPLKAVQSFGLIKCSSPRRFSPDSRQSESTVTREQPGSVGIRRTGSFDLISSNIYLNGEWPKLCTAIGQTCLISEKSTQTPDEWKDLHSFEQLVRKTKAVNSVSPNTRADAHKEFQVRPVMKLGKEKTPVFHRTATSKPLLIPVHSRLTCHYRGSLEGLNQEIEKLVTNSSLTLDGIKSPMDGHREPVAYQLNTCSRVTQTPTADGAFGKMELDMCHEEIQLKEDAHEEPDDCDIKMFKESPECINFHSLKAFNGRLPPEGCEKVEGKFKEIRDHGLEKVNVPCMKQPVIECHIPSESSAFNPLAKTYLNQSTELAHQLAGLTMTQSCD